MASIESSSGLSTQELTELQVYRQILNDYTNPIIDAKKNIRMVEDNCFKRYDNVSCEYLKTAGNEINSVIDGIKKRVVELENKMQVYQNHQEEPLDFNIPKR